MGILWRYPRWSWLRSWLILALCSGCFSFILHALMSVQGAFEHLTFVCPQQWQLLHSRPRISLRDWQCLDSQFNFSNSSLALATCTFKICRCSSISCRWKSKGLFSVFSFPPSAVLSYYLSTQSTLPLTPRERTQKKKTEQNTEEENTEPCPGPSQLIPTLPTALADCVQCAF